MKISGALGRMLIWGLVLLCFGGAALSRSFRHSALQHVVDGCETAKRLVGISFPCVQVRLEQPGHSGYAVVRAPHRATEVLVVPLQPVSGIEDPSLLSDAHSDIWSAAWSSRHYITDKLERAVPRTDLGMAVNSIAGRSQDQFHIHVDCVDPAVVSALGAARRRISSKWTRFPEELNGSPYWVRAVPSADLSGINLADLVADGLPPTHDAVTESMRHVTVAAIGGTMRDGTDGFFLLANTADGAAEHLLDHSCRIS